MDTSNALAALTALSQETRLNAFRLLLQAGEEGLAAGEISARLDVRQNTMSAALSGLVNAGLAVNRREGRSIRYFADFNAMGALLSFLMEDCCGGTPDRCRPLIAEIACSGTSGETC